MKGLGMAFRAGEYIGITLLITSPTLDADTISVLIGFKPNYTQVRGNTAGSMKRLYECHSWSLGERLYAKPGEQLAILSYRLSHVSSVLLEPARCKFKP